MLKVQKSCRVLSWIPLPKNKVVLTSVFNTLHTLTQFKVQTKAFKKSKYAFSESSYRKEFPVNLILKDFQKNLKPGDVLVEFHPGKGLLTKKILSVFNNKLLLCKPHNILVRDIKASYPDKLSKLTIADIEVLNSVKHFYQSIYHNVPKYHKEFVRVLESHSPVDKSSNLFIIGTVRNKKFFYNLITDYVYRATFFYGKLNPTFYTFVPYPLYLYLLKLDRLVVSLGTTFKLYFDIEVLGSAPSKSFYIVGSKNSYKRDQGCKDMFLLKIKPKDYNTVAEKTGNNLIEFNHFLQYTTRLKAPSFVFGVESFVYDCGEELIKNGFNPFDKIFDITEDQWFKSFEVIRSHRHYDSALFNNNIFGNDVLELYEDYEDEEALNNELHEVSLHQPESQSDELEADKIAMINFMNSEDIVLDDESEDNISDEDVALL